MRYLGSYNINGRTNIDVKPIHINGGNYFGVEFSGQTNLGATQSQPGKGFYSTYAYWETNNRNEVSASRIKQYENHPEVLKRKQAIQQAFGSEAQKYMWAANPYNFEWNAFYGSSGDWQYGLGVHFDPDEIESWNPAFTSGYLSGNQILVRRTGNEIFWEKGSWRELGGKKRKVVIEALSGLSINLDDPYPNQMIVSKFNKDLTSVSYKDLRKFAAELPSAKKCKPPITVPGKPKTVIPINMLCFNGDSKYSRFFWILYWLQTVKDDDFKLTRGEMRDRVNRSLDSLNQLLKNFYKDMSGGSPVWNNYFYSHTSFAAPQLSDPPDNDRIPPAYEHGNDVVIPIVKLYYILVYLIMFSMPYPKAKKQARDQWIKKLVALAPPCVDVKYTLDRDGKGQAVLDYFKKIGLTQAYSENITLVPEDLVGPRPFVFFKLREAPGHASDVTKRINERQGEGSLLIYGLPYGVASKELQESFKRDESWWDRYGKYVIAIGVAAVNTAINVAIPGLGSTTNAIGKKLSQSTVGGILKVVSEITLEVTRMYVNSKGVQKIQETYQATREAQTIFMYIQNTGGGQGGKASNPMDFPYDFIFWWPDWIAAQLIQSVDNPLMGIPESGGVPAKGGGLGRFEDRPPFFTWSEYYWCWMTWYIANIKTMMAGEVRAALAGTVKPVYPYVPPAWVKAFDEKIAQQQQQQAVNIEKKAKKEKAKKYATYGAYALAGMVVLGTLGYALLRKKDQS